MDPLITSFQFDITSMSQGKEMLNFLSLYQNILVMKILKNYAELISQTIQMFNLETVLYPQNRISHACLNKSRHGP